MKRAFINEKNQLSERLSGYVYMMFYQYMNLCVKAEVGALMPIYVTIEGQAMKLEEVAKVGQNDEYSFLVFPDYDDDIPHIQEAVAQVHPEFKQELKTDTVHVDDGDKDDVVKFIQLTMPEVDNDRYDLLKEGVNLLYDECKAQMELARLKATPNIAAVTAGESAEDIKKMEDAVDEVVDMWTSHRDKLHEDKLKEIEDAHEKYLTAKANREMAAREQEEALGESRITSMKMTGE